MINQKVSPTEIREMNFYSGDTKASPNHIFESFYSPLDQLIDHNRKHAGSGKFRSMSMGSDYSQPSEKLVSESTSGVLEGSKNWTVKVKMGNGNEKIYNIKPRTNFDQSLMKRPSIAYLESTDDNSILVLREARSYDLKGFVGKVARQHYGTHLNIGESPELKHNEIKIVPEAPLVLALERIALEHDSLRITPKIRIIGQKGSDMWYVRNFLPSLRDSSMDMREFSKYAGTLHGLGLMDSMDIDSSEYCKEGTQVVNVDPDLFAYTPSDNILDHHGWGAINRNVLSELLFGGRSAEELCRKDRRKQMEVTRGLLNGKSLMDYFSADTSGQTLSLLGIDNFYS